MNSADEILGQVKVIFAPDFSVLQMIVLCVEKYHPLLSKQSFSITLQHWEHIFDPTETYLRPHKNIPFYNYKDISTKKSSGMWAKSYI